MPMIGQVDVLTRNVIAGWAADASRPELSVGVRCTINGKTQGLPAAGMRDDLAGIFQGATGRYGFRLEDGLLPLSPFIDNDVEVTFARTGEPVPGGTVTIPALARSTDIRARGVLRPTVVTTPGRSGSSLLMARLAAHPEILVARDHPYELKLLSYYAKALTVLTTEADRQRSAHPDTMFSPAARYSLGFNPFNDATDRRDPLLCAFWDRTAPGHLQDCFTTLVDLYYRAIAQQTGKRDPATFAEKVGTSELVRQAVTYMFDDVRELVLVRDPRDIICSAKSFWQRDFDSSVRELRGQFAAMSRPRTDARLTQHVVRYEDLILRPDVTMHGVFAFLDVDSSFVGIDRGKESRAFGVHGTTATPQETISRWRRDLSAAEIATANRELETFLDMFGYTER